MDKTQKILVREIIDSEFAVSLDRADILFNFLKEILSKDEKIELSFDGIEVLLTIFANESIGKLYETFESSVIENITIVDIDANSMDTIARVKKKSAEFYKK